MQNRVEKQIGIKCFRPVGKTVRCSNRYTEKNDQDNLSRQWNNVESCRKANRQKTS